MSHKFLFKWQYCQNNLGENVRHIRNVLFSFLSFGFPLAAVRGKLWTRGKPKNVKQLEIIHNNKHSFITLLMLSARAHFPNNDVRNARTNEGTWYMIYGAKRPISCFVFAFFDIGLGGIASISWPPGSPLKFIFPQSRQPEPHDRIHWISLLKCFWAHSTKICCSAKVQYFILNYHQRRRMLSINCCFCRILEMRRDNVTHFEISWEKKWATFPRREFDFFSRKRLVRGQLLTFSKMPMNEFYFAHGEQEGCRRSEIFSSKASFPSLRKIFRFRRYQFFIDLAELWLWLNEEDFRENQFLIVTYLSGQTSQDKQLIH